tara:strand:+ start:1144 stop:1395 length:252 start_codon:yes stop_codon:yes gene_type:complete
MAALIPALIKLFMSSRGGGGGGGGSNKAAAAQKKHTAADQKRMAASGIIKYGESGTGTGSEPGGGRVRKVIEGTRAARKGAEQ